MWSRIGAAAGAAPGATSWPACKECNNRKKLMTARREQLLHDAPSIRPPED